VRGKTWRSIQDKFYKSKTSSRFPNFDASNAWQMGHNSPEGFFLGKNCSWTLLPGSTWVQTTITRLYQLHSKLQNTFRFFKTCWWLTGLSRLYDASQPPGSYKRYFKTMLKIPHLFFPRWYPLTLDQFMCCVSRHNDRCQHSVPRFLLYMLWDLILISYTINSLPVCCSTLVFSSKVNFVEIAPNCACSFVYVCLAMSRNFSG